MAQEKYILPQLFRERNSSTSTQNMYRRSTRFYENITGETIETLIQTADEEETQNIRWKNTITRKHLINYREFLYDKYNISTAKLYLSAIITIYRHFEITIPQLPHRSTVGVRKTPPLQYNDLLDREILREAINISSPVIKSLILFMSSSGMSRIDTINLRIKDWLNATQSYHNYNTGNCSVKQAIQQMRGETNIIPVFNGLHRQKTGLEYFTFCSHEASKFINEYLLTRTEILEYNDPLFKIHERYFNMAFERLNDHFQLGKVGNYNRLRPHMLRKYHATQLAEAGMSTDHINLLQGRKIRGVAHEYYIKINPESLRDEYVDCLPFLVIDDANKYKSELEIMKNENTTLKDSIEGILERLNRIEIKKENEED